jgi:integrase
MSDNSDPIRFLLTYQMDRYIKFITNGGFHSFEAPKELDISTINDYKRNFRYFLESVAGQVDILRLRFDDIREEHVDIFHQYLLKKNYARKSYNNIMGSLRSFYNHLIDYEEFDIRNPFRKVPILSVHYNPATYSKEEFGKILSVVTDANGYDKKAKRNWYRSWLPTAFKFGIYTNLRLDELANLRFSDIFEDDGAWFLRVDNIKVNALLGITDASVKRSMIIPVIPELYKVLGEECDFEQQQGSDVYVFEPESSRRTVHSAIGKGFTHYKRVAKIAGGKSFKELRTTFTTGLAVKYGEKFASLVTDHSSKDVLDKHYIEKIARAKAMRDFSPFEANDSEKN